MVGRSQRNRRRGHPLTAFARTLLALLSAVYLWAVGWMTLRAAPYGSEIGEGLDRILAYFATRPATAWITFDRVEFAANVAMFVPLGVLCVLWFGVRRWWTAPLVGLALSGVIEFAQATFLTTRVADTRDLIANTLGAVVGMLLTLALAFFLAATSSRGRRSTART